MSFESDLEKIKLSKVKIRRLVNDLNISLAYDDVTTKDKGVLDRVLRVAISRVGKLVTTSPPENMTYKERVSFLIHKNKNSEAVKKLIGHLKDGDLWSIFTLGKIYMNGLRNKLGKVEFLSLSNSHKCLTHCSRSNYPDSAYYLGLLLKKSGDADNAEKIFEAMHNNGCVKSSTELIIILKEKISVADSELDKLKLMQRVLIVRSDIEYNL